MNNLMRRSGILAVLCLVLCMILLVTACGGDKDPEGTTEAETTTGSDVTTDGNVTTETPDDDVTTDGDVTTEDPGNVTTETPDDGTTETPDAKVTYTVTVKDADGNPIAGVSVQLCEGDRCLLPVTTDASGVASFSDVEAVYQAQITKAVSGYVVDTAKKYDFASGAKALEIVLEKAAVDVVVPGSTTDITASVGSVDAPESVELEANATVSYLYEALTDGTLSVNLVGGEAATITVSNVTTNKAGFTVDGVGSIELSTRAGNSYLIMITATEAETVEFYVALSDEGNGSKENPFHLYMGDVQTTVKVPAGETVYFVYEDERYLLIENPTVTVDLNGVVYVPDIYGNITAEAIGLKSGDLFGVVGGAEDTTVTIKLTGSDAEHPLTVRDIGIHELNIPVGATAYFTVDMGARNCVLDSITGNVTASSWGVEFTAPVLFHQSPEMGVSAFALTNNSNAYVAPVEFNVVTAPAGIFDATPIVLDDTGSTTVTLHDQKIAKSLYFTATAAEYGYFKTNVPGAPLAINGEAVTDIIDLSVDGILVNPGDEILFVLNFDAVEDTYLSYGVEYVPVVLEDYGTTEITIPAGASYRVTAPIGLLMNGVYYKGITGEGFEATCNGEAVAPNTMFSNRGLYEVILTNTNAAEATVTIEVAELPAGIDMNKAIELTGASGTASASELVANFAWNDQAVAIMPEDPMGDWTFIAGSVTYYTYEVETAGTFKLTLADDQMLNLDFSGANDAEGNILWSVDAEAFTTGVEVEAGWTIIIAVVDTTEGAVEFGYEVVAATVDETPEA